jgi:hypothetical protein
MDRVARGTCRVLRAPCSVRSSAERSRRSRSRHHVDAHRPARSTRRGSSSAESEPVLHPSAVSTAVLHHSAASDSVQAGSPVHSAMRASVAACSDSSVFHSLVVWRHRSRANEPGRSLARALPPHRAARRSGPTATPPSIDREVLARSSWIPVVADETNRQHQRRRRPRTRRAAS